MFSGDYGTINRVIIANVNYQELFLIDDGVLTIHLHNTILNPHRQESIPFSKQMKMVRYLLFGLRINIKGSINFFTCYNLIPHDTEMIVKNNYHYLQHKYLNNLQDDNRLYLLGQNFLQTNILDNATYINYLKKSSIIIKLISSTFPIGLKLFQTSSKKCSMIILSYNHQKVLLKWYFLCNKNTQKTLFHLTQVLFSH